MNLRVIKHLADVEKESYKVVLKGEADFGISCLVTVEVSLKAKVEDLLDEFPIGGRFTVTVETLKGGS